MDEEKIGRILKEGLDHIQANLNLELSNLKAQIGHNAGVSQAEWTDLIRRVERIDLTLERAENHHKDIKSEVIVLKAEYQSIREGTGKKIDQLEREIELYKSFMTQSQNAQQKKSAWRASVAEKVAVWGIILILSFLLAATWAQVRTILQNTMPTP